MTKIKEAAGPAYPATLTEAIIQVMQEVKGIEKNTVVGLGKNSYKGVADKDVKATIGAAMARAGLAILPIGIEEDTSVVTWDSLDYNGKPTVKQQVTTRVKTTYLLLHVSGESREIQGIGHGVDPQDKAAGKATTYALKYALLYSFLVPTGAIDDADNTHSEQIPVVPAKPQPPAAKAKPDLDEARMQYMISFLLEGGQEKIDAVSDSMPKYNISPEQKTTLDKAISDAKKALERQK